MLTKTHIIIQKYVDKLWEEHQDFTEKKAVTWKKKNTYLDCDEMPQNAYNVLCFESLIFKKIKTIKPC